MNANPVMLFFLRKANGLIFLSFLFFSDQSLAQFTKFWVQFTDKNSSPYTTTNPSVYLSQRSIQRRANQNIPITFYDLPVNPSYVTQVLSTGNVTLNFRSRWFNAISITTSDQNALNFIATLPFVQSVTGVGRMKRPDNFREEEDWESYLKMQPPPNLLQVPYNYGNSFAQANQVNAVCLHNQGYSGQGMVIAVLDDGFRNVNTIQPFDSIRINNQILGTYDFVANSPNVYGVGGHGTQVLSCMAGYTDNQLVGTAPKAKYYLLRTENASTEFIVEEDYWVAGAEYADSVGADIICTSLYYTTFDNPSQNHTYAQMDGKTTRCAKAAAFTARVGMITFACAGNSGTSSWFYIGTPADADSILAVGAVNSSGALASFSSRGPSSDGRVKPDICARGVSAVVCNTSGGITTASGTSFATPICAGAAACLWQSQPTFSAMQIRQAIIQSSSQYLNPDSLKGYGIPNFCNASIIVGGSEISSGSHTNIFPNPAFPGSEIFFRGFEGDGLLTLTDVQGKIIFRGKISGNTTHSIKTPEHAGLYFWTVAGTSKMVSGKLIVKD
jgi:serine protease AprX